MRTLDKTVTLNEAGDMAKVTGNCKFTGEEYSVTVPTAGLQEWLDGVHIQDALPGVSADDREFLISGISPKGWKETFG
jgi:hypothetical protein